MAGYRRLLERGLGRTVQMLKNLQTEKHVRDVASAGLVDSSWYLERYPDVADSNIDAITHFVIYGFHEGRDPRPDVSIAKFKREWEAPEFPDANKSIYGLIKWFKQVRGETVEDAEQTNSAAAAAIEVLQDSGLFNFKYYLRQYPEVASRLHGSSRDMGLAALRHYIEHGASEGRNPNPMFDTRYYLDRNPDVARSSINPLLHFATYGWAELRSPSPEFDTGWYYITNALEVGVEVNPLWHYLETDEGSRVRSRPSSPISPEDRHQLAAAVEELLESNTLSASRCNAVGCYLMKKGLAALAESCFRHGLSTNHDHGDCLAGLVRSLRKQGKWWQLADLLDSKMGLIAEDSSLLFSLGEARERMRQWSLASIAYSKALGCAPPDPDLHYRLGFCYEQLQSADQSAAHYSFAISLDTSLRASRFGIGVFHQKYGRWSAAAAAYRKETHLSPIDEELWYRLGVALDRQYLWAQAEDAYRKSLFLNTTASLTHYRLGFVLERQEKFADAAIAYFAALRLTTRAEPLWVYRWAYVLAKDGRFEEASEAFQVLGDHFGKSVKESGSTGRYLAHDLIVAASSTSPDLKSYFDNLSKARPWGETEAISSSAEAHYRRGEAAELAGNYVDAVREYSTAIERQSDFLPSWYFRLGFCLARQGKYEAACNAYSKMVVIGRPVGVDMTAYERNADLLAVMHYNEYLETLPVRKRTILYESYHGMSMACNPLAIFKCVAADQRYSDWTHIWVLSDLDDIPAPSASNALGDNVIYIRRNSDAYRRYLASASHLVSNSTFPSWFIRRPEQSYLNTWHGTPFKALGKDNAESVMEHRNTARNLLQASHLITANPHTTRVLMQSYDVAELFNGKVAETGYPRVDLLLNSTSELRDRLRKRLGLAADEPVVLYAPTYRGSRESPKLEASRLVAVLQKIGRRCRNLVFRGHYFTEDLIGQLNVPAIVAPHDIDTCELLSIVDVLITDYSSIVFDFIPSGRPIVFFVPDEDAYRRSRGLYFDFTELPGTVCSDLPQLESELVKLLSSRMWNSSRPDPAAMMQYCPMEDGRSSIRAVEFFLESCEDYVVEHYRTSKSAILTYGGEFLPNGITTSLLNLSEAIDESELGYRNIISVDADAITSSTKKLDKFRALSAGTGVIARTGRMVMSPEERWLTDRLGVHLALSGEEQWSVYGQAFKREFRRLFGDSRVAVLVNFDGYSRYWTSLFGFGGDPQRRVTYLHNDMLGERDTRFPHLASIFQLFSRYDKLVSVSESVCAVNKVGLGPLLNIPESRFVYCDNLLNPNAAIELAQRPIDEEIERWIGPDGLLFVTMGRLSPEKGHEKLIRAFSNLLQMGIGRPKLVIAGEGPLLMRLRRLILDLGLESSVLLAGQLSNPYPLLKRCDLFVFSSDYEGQGLAILEALILGKPVVSTNVPGPKTVLAGGQGLLVENSEEGLQQGMAKFITGELCLAPFDVVAYQENALRAFVDSVLADGSSGANANLERARTGMSKGIAQAEEST